MLPISKVQNLILKHAQLEKELSSGEIDKKNIAEKFLLRMIIQETKTQQK